MLAKYTVLACFVLMTRHICVQLQFSVLFIQRVYTVSDSDFGGI
jgi:hypothetical protein